jgi:L,D-peptidoglycan transpeptidase YkuD (ErfK/YbiS/YcfS/YnhG family)
MHSRTRSLLASAGAALLVAGGLVATTLLTAPAAQAASAPLRVITVSAPSATSTTATLDLWTASSLGGYWHAAGPVRAWVGELGVGQAREGIARTPAGVFTLTQAFGNQPDNGSALPYFQATRADWWDGESGTPQYNTHLHQVASPGPNSENLYDAGFVYSHAVVIDYNRFPVRAGAGSAFFLHVTNGEPTAGCVAVDAHSLDVIMRWLLPSAHPVISIGVGAAATAIITSANAAAAAHNPFGHVDSVTGGQGVIRVSGWAADPDNTSAALSIDIYIDNRMRGRYATGVARPDVALARHTGPKQGYAITVPGVAAGSHLVCAYALNIGLGTSNTKFLPCSTVTTG